MEIPILKIKNILIVSIQVDLSDRSVLSLQQNLLQQIDRTGATGVLIDLTAVEIIDSFMSRALTETAQMAKIMGTNVVLVGIQPAVAITMVELGVYFKDTPTRRNLETGLEYLEKESNAPKGWGWSG
ncbi:MAG: STAS domain-containing protein [Bacillota bacterium]|jgi:rsbT antagonist protein RsbS